MVSTSEIAKRYFYFAALFDAFPDFRIEITELTSYRNRSAVRWRACGTFAGPGARSQLERAASAPS